MPEIIPNWHPIFVHFTIALLSTSTAFLTLSKLLKGKKSSWLHTAGLCNLWAGALITLGTVAAGFYAYNTVAHDAPSHAAMTDHKNWAIATAAFFILLALCSLKYQKKSVPYSFIGALAIASIFLGITGLKGGEAVYRFGLGVMSLPQSEGEEHGHSHADIDNDHDNKKSSNSAQPIAKRQNHQEGPNHRKQDENFIKTSKEKLNNTVNSHDSAPHDH
jgi:uncharacterized membrane protein